MRGSLRQRSKGSWEITIDIGRDPATGKCLRHFKTVKGTKKDAQQRLAALMVSTEKGSYMKTVRDLSLTDYLVEWLQSHVELHCRPRTAEGYWFIVNRHLIPRIGQDSLK